MLPQTLSKIGVRSSAEVADSADPLIFGRYYLVDLGEREPVDRHF